MQTIGELLQKEREFHAISLEEMAGRTRIKKEFLMALEANDFAALPAIPYVKGYIRAYGQIFGFDHAPLLAMLRRDFDQSSSGGLVVRGLTNSKVKFRRIWTPIHFLIMSVATIFFSLFIYVAWQWFLFQQPPKLKVSSPEDAAVVSGQVEIVGRTSSESVVLVNAQPVALQADGSFRTELFLPRSGLNTITIQATDRKGKTTVEQRTVRVEF